MKITSKKSSNLKKSKVAKQKSNTARKNNRQYLKEVNIKKKNLKLEQAKNCQTGEAQSTKPGKLSVFFNHFSTKVTRISGSVYTFIVAILLIIIWVITGPIFKFSDTWQLVINTGTTIITFLMVFIIQHSQNKDTVALQLKLNELIAASQASNKLISVEDLTDEELEVMQKFYVHLSNLTKKEKENKIHSLEEEKDILDKQKENIEENIEEVKNSFSKK